VRRVNCLAKPGKGVSFLESLLSVFRVNFFKKKNDVEDKEKKGPTKPNPLSKTSIRRKQKSQRNK
jgi:hypothetical protein